MNTNINISEKSMLLIKRKQLKELEKKNKNVSLIDLIEKAVVAAYGEVEDEKS